MLETLSSCRESVASFFSPSWEGLFDSLPDSQDNFSEKRRKAMENITFNNDKDIVLKTMLRRLKFPEDQNSQIEMRIKSRAKDSEDIRLLMTIPGIDCYLASLLSSYIGNVKRFPSEAKLASFFGVGPSYRDSSSIVRRGHTSKEGANIARWALSIAVDTVKIRNKAIGEYYNRHKERTGSGSLAHVVTMRKLIRMVYHMLSERKEWKYQNVALTKRKLNDVYD